MLCQLNSECLDPDPEGRNAFLREEGFRQFMTGQIGNSGKCQDPIKWRDREREREHVCTESTALLVTLYEEGETMTGCNRSPFIADAIVL